jgi:hypothetical protein
MSDPARKGQPVDEDDNFGDFPMEEWSAAQMDPKDPSLWDSSWDDNSLEDAVGQQIRTITPQVVAELDSKPGQAQQQDPGQQQ